MIDIDKTVEEAKETLGLSYVAYDSMVKTRDDAQAEINDIIELMGEPSKVQPGILSFFEALYLISHKMTGGSFLGKSFSTAQDTKTLLIDNMKTSKVLYPDSLNEGVDDVGNRMNFDVNNSYLTDFGMSFTISSSLNNASISSTITSIKTPVTSDDGTKTYSYTSSEKQSITNVYNQFKDLLSDAYDKNGELYTTLCEDSVEYLDENFDINVGFSLNLISELLSLASNLAILKNTFNVINSTATYSGRSSYDTNLVNYCNLFQSNLGNIKNNINFILNQIESIVYYDTDINSVWKLYFAKLNIRPSGLVMTLEGANTAISSLENQIEQNLFLASVCSSSENVVLPTPKIEAIYKKEDENGEEKYFLSFSAIPCYTSIVLRSLSPFDIFPIKTWSLDEIINFSEVELPEELLTMGKEYRFILSRSPYSSTAVTFDFYPSTNVSFDF